MKSLSFNVTLSILCLVIGIVLCNYWKKSMIIQSEKFVQTTHANIYTTTYYTHATQNATPLLVIHGGPGILNHTYLTSLQEIAHTRPVILYDQLGCGKSIALSNNIEYNFDLYYTELEEIINYLGLHRCSLFGHSWGAALAATYAAKHPDHVEKLILASPFLSSQHWINNTIKHAYAITQETGDALTYYETINDLTNPVYQQALQRYSSTYQCSMQPWPELLTTSVNPTRTIYDMLWGRYETKCTGTLKNLDTTPLLANISCPTLVTVGKSDSADAAYIKEQSKKIPNATYVIFEKSCHFAHLEQTELYNQTIMNFLDEQ